MKKQFSIFFIIIYSFFFFPHSNLYGMESSQLTKQFDGFLEPPTLEQAISLLVTAQQYKTIAILFRVLFFDARNDINRHCTIVKTFIRAKVGDACIKKILCEECDVTETHAASFLKIAHDQLTEEANRPWGFNEI